MKGDDRRQWETTGDKTTSEPKKPTTPTNTKAARSKVALRTPTVNCLGKNLPAVVVNWKFSKPPATTKKPLVFFLIQRQSGTNLLCRDLRVSSFPSFLHQNWIISFHLTIAIVTVEKKTLKKKREDSLRFQQNLSKCTQSSRKDLRA